MGVIQGGPEILPPGPESAGKCQAFGLASINTFPNAGDGLETWPCIDEDFSINRVSCIIIDVSITLYINEYR